MCADHASAADTLMILKKTKKRKNMITFEQIEKANAILKPSPIKGKDYIEVNQRIKAFRMLHPNGSIQTEIISLENGVCIIQAKALDEEGMVLGTGLAYEKEGSTFINKTSYIENCETSTVGRALGMLGIGIGASVASYEEIANAQAQQEDKPEHSKTKEEADKPITKSAAQALEKALLENDIPVEWVLGCCKVSNLTEIPYANYVWMLHHIDECKQRADKWKAKQNSKQ